MTTLLELLPEYRDYLKLERQLSTQTQLCYTSDARKLAAFIDKPVADITRKDMRRYMQELGRLGRKANTVRRVFHGFGTLFTWLKLEGHIKEVVTEHLTLPRKNQGIPRWMSEQELRQLLTAQGPRLEVLAWQTLAFTGMRPDELRRLTVADVKLDDENSHLIVRNTKSRRDRIIPLNDALLVGFDWLTHGKPDSAYVFANRFGRIWRRQLMIKAFYRQLGRAGLSGRGYKMYALRHTFATQLANSGVNLHIVKEILGHRSLETTQIYLHASPASIRQAMMRVSEVGK